VGGTCLFFRYVCLLAFSNWRWFEENCRPNEENGLGWLREENIIFIFFIFFWDSWLGWVGLGWVGFVRKTSSLFFGILGWVGLGWVGLALRGGGKCYSFGTFVHSCVLKLEIVWERANKKIFSSFLSFC